MHLRNMRERSTHTGHPLSWTVTIMHTRCTKCETAFCGTRTHYTIQQQSLRVNTLRVLSTTVQTGTQNTRYCETALTRPQIRHWRAGIWHLAIITECTELSVKMLWWIKFRKTMFLKGRMTKLYLLFQHTRCCKKNVKRSIINVASIHVTGF
jgi:hypothetical protein